MKFTSTTVKTAIGAAGIATAGVFTAATAVAAPPTIQGFGTSEQLVDGPLVTAYTVSNLQPSNATIPGYTPQGHLYEANITAQANSGTVTPLVSDFNARAANGQQYRVLTPRRFQTALARRRLPKATRPAGRSTSTSPARSRIKSSTTTVFRTSSSGRTTPNPSVR